jgi:hypothetical protein
LRATPPASQPTAHHLYQERFSHPPRAPRKAPFLHSLSPHRFRRRQSAPPGSLGTRRGTHTLRYADETTPTKRRRPKEAGYLDLRIIAAPITIGIWPNPESTAEALAAAGAFMRSERITKSPFTIQHDRAHAGWCATYHARWMTNTNKPGRWGLSASMIIAFGGPVPPPPE